MQSNGSLSKAIRKAIVMVHLGRDAH
jgi:hypothetical protein